MYGVNKTAGGSLGPRLPGLLIGAVADHAEKFLTDESADGPRRGRTADVRASPAAGPLLGITPWDLPLRQVIGFAVPALQAGTICLTGGLSTGAIRPEGSICSINSSMASCRWPMSRHTSATRSGQDRMPKSSEPS